MTSSLFDRILFSLYGAIVGIGSLFLVILSVKMIHQYPSLPWSFNFQPSPWINIAVLFVAVLLFLISIRLIYLMFRVREKYPASIDQRTDFGDIYISLETIRQLSLKAASRIHGARNIKSRVQVNEKGLEIVIRTFVDGESSITELTEAMQKDIKHYIEHITGIPVARVSVFVANILEAQQTVRSRVEKSRVE